MRELRMDDSNESLLAVKTYTPIRWTSLKECIDRILQIWRPLEEFFKRTDAVVHNSYFNQEYFAMLKLLQNLLSNVNDLFEDFQQENLETLEVVTSLKRHLICISKYIFKIDPTDTDASYRKLQSFITGNPEVYEKTQDYLAIARSFDEFKSYYIEKNSYLKILVDALGSSQKDRFYKSAFEFVQAIFENMRVYLPRKKENILMLTDAFLLRKVKPKMLREK